MELKGKKILFIGPEFYDYHNSIIDELIVKGAEVDYFPEILDSILYRLTRHYLKNISKRMEENYLNSILEQMQDMYDCFFLIRGEIITHDFLQAIKNKMPYTKFIMYQWDSYKNNPNYLNILTFFDSVMTFDMVDAKEKNIEYLPLFYTKEYENLNLNEHKEYDIVFFGAYHSDRLKIVKELYNQCLRLNLKFYSVIYITKMALFVRLLSKKITFDELRYLTFKPVNRSIILATYKKTKSVLDIESIGQKGLTIRTFEVLGSSLKLITTNKSIINEPFYDEKMILFVNRDEMKSLDVIFFKTTNIQNSSFKNYTLAEWIEQVFSKC